MIKNLVEQEQLKEQMKEVNNDIEALEDDLLYARNGGSFMGVNESGEVYKVVVPPSQGKEIPIEVKSVVQSHDEALETLSSNLVPFTPIQGGPMVNSTYGSGDVYSVSIGKLAVATGTVTFSAEKPAGLSYAIASGLLGPASGTAFVSSNIQDAYPVYINSVGKLVSNVAIPTGTVLRFTTAYVIK